MDLFYEKYADAVLFSALGLKPTDILSINTDEEDYAFARLLAEKAKKITGNGSYIQTLENGRIKEEFDLLSPFPLKKSPTAFIYVSLMKPMGKVTENTELEPPVLQTFRLLSDPVDNPRPSFPFISVPLPCRTWDKLLDEENASSTLLYNLLGLDNDDYLNTLEMMKSNALYLKDKANAMEFTAARIVDDEGTDLSFRFQEGSFFMSSVDKTLDGRVFSPFIFANDIFRLIEPLSAEGWINISRPILLFGKKVSNLSLRFHEGKVVEVKGSTLGEALMRLYLLQDPFASWASMLTLSPSSSLDEEEYTGSMDWDRMRNVSLTIGGPKGEASNETLQGKVVDSIVTLSLPIGNESTLVYMETKGGEERLVYSDRYIDLEEDED